MSYSIFLKKYPVQPTPNVNPKELFYCDSETIFSIHNSQIKFRLNKLNFLLNSDRTYISQILFNLKIEVFFRYVRPYKTENILNNPVKTIFSMNIDTILLTKVLSVIN